MNQTTPKILIALLATLIMAPALGAEDTPKGLWLKVKCALCHGEDGASETPTGKKTKAPDLRTPEIQKLTDDQLSKLVEEGHAKMPSFRIQLSKAQIKMLVFYIREISPKDVKQAPEQGGEESS